MANTVLLIQALGGGWDRSSIPERSECCGMLVSGNAPNPIVGERRAPHNNELVRAITHT